MSLSLVVLVFPALADDAVTLTLKSRILSVCGLPFQQLYYTSSNPGYLVETASIELPGTSYRVSVPRTLQRTAQYVAANPSAKAAVTQSKFDSQLSAAPLLGDFPISSLDGDRKQNEAAFCEYVKKYDAAYRAANISSLESNDLLKLSLSAGKLGVSVANSSLTLSESLRSPVKIAVLSRPTPGESVRQPDYLILVQDIYANDVIPLANYRQSQGYTVEIKKVTELPGYDANGPTPEECTGIYERECYHLWNEALVGFPGNPSTVGAVSPLAVPSQFGMNRQTKVGQPYIRVTSMAGIIRAYLRRKVALNPNFKAAFLVGDPEVIPASAYQPGFTYIQGVTSVSLSTGTDIYYSAPVKPIFPTPISSQISYAYEFTQPRIYRCKDSSGVIRYRKWCLPGEVLPGGVTWNGIAWDDNVPFGDNSNWLSFFDIPIKRAYSTLPCYPQWANCLSSPNPANATPLIAVGRLPTQSTYRLGADSRDPSVRNYVQKLIYWESNLPSLTGNSRYIFGGEQFWIWDPNDITNFSTNYGSASKIYGSKMYFQPINEYGNTVNFYLNSTTCPACSFKSTDATMLELPTETRAAWYLAGHGSPIGIGGTVDSANRAANSVFSVNKSYSVDYGGYFGVPGQLHASGPASDSVISSYDGTQKLIGHVVANSCDPGTFTRYTSAFKDYKENDPQSDAAGFAQRLLIMPSGGAINTYMNVNVGWGGSDNRMNRLFADKVYEAWDQCGRMGDAYLKVISSPSAANLTWAVHNRYLGGDPLAKIARPSRNCNTSGDPVVASAGVVK